MSEEDRPDTISHPGPVAAATLPDEDTAELRLPVTRRRLKKLRFLAILFAVMLLGVISFAFGMFMAVASDLPELENRYEFTHAKNTTLLDDQGHPLGVLSQQNRIILTPNEIPQMVKDAVISVEDKRFYSNSGIDLRGIARAFVNDVFKKGGLQGASTIEQQFVKNALRAQSHRTIFEKLREAALAFHLAHKWSKNKIITEYLNTIYFGNGAYGIESAARTYFGQDVNHQGCGLPKAPLCVSELEPWEAALLAGMIASPTEYNPVTHPQVAKRRRNQVLKDMFEQGYLNGAEYDESIREALPAPHDIEPPQVAPIDGLQTGYFTSWVQQQLIERYTPTLALEGGLKVRTSLDLGLQRAAEQAIDGYLPGPEGPSASLVAIDNATGEVRAMVGGRDYNESPFNLATEGERQPGSSFKAFDLAAALEKGISPYSEWPSKEKTFYVHGPNGTEKFVVHNDEGAYTGENTLTNATAYSDNSIYAEVGLKVGTKRIAHLAHRMGIDTPISTNPAMTIGGLNVGVTPLDMAHAYETIAHGGLHVGSSLIPGNAPTGIKEVDAQHGQTLPDGHHRDINRPVLRRVLPAGVAQTETEMLETVLQYGTAKAAAIGQFAAGKTGTTSNYGDAWFVGWDSKYTVAVWVGFPNSLVPMTTEFDGGPVLGGTFPALIWHNFMLAALNLEKEQTGKSSAKSKPGETSTTTELAAESSTSTATPPKSSKISPGANSSPEGQEHHPNSTPASPGVESESPPKQEAPSATPPAATPTPASPQPSTPPTESPPPTSNAGGTGAPTGGTGPGG
jgi:penicillin-binding protein 1A